MTKVEIDKLLIKFASIKQSKTVEFWLKYNNSDNSGGSHTCLICNKIFNYDFIIISDKYRSYRELIEAHKQDHINKLNCFI